MKKTSVELDDEVWNYLKLWKKKEEGISMHFFINDKAKEDMKANEKYQEYLREKNET